MNKEKGERRKEKSRQERKERNGENSTLFEVHICTYVHKYQEQRSSNLNTPDLQKKVVADKRKIRENVLDSFYSATCVDLRVRLASAGQCVCQDID